MTRPTFEVADILRTHGDRFLDRYRSSFGFQQLKAFRAILRCRTAALGGHRDACLNCGHQAISYNSCRNRHSNSQTIRTIAWAADVRQDRTLPENGTAANRGRQKLRFQTLHIAELGTFRRLTLPEIPSSLLLMCPTYSLLDIRRSD
jgi:hypothetical protein